jgi:hypothetical protein
VEASESEAGVSAAAAGDISIVVFVAVCVRAPDLRGVGETAGARLFLLLPLLVAVLEDKDTAEVVVLAEPVLAIPSTGTGTDTAAAAVKGALVVVVPV